MLDKDTLLHLLREKEIPFICEHHQPVFTMLEWDKLGLSLDGTICKNLLLQDKDGRYFHVVTTATKSLNLAAAAVTLGSKRLSLASEETLFSLLGIRTGSLSPLALVNDEALRIRIVIDAQLASEPTFLLHPLENTATVALRNHDLMSFLSSIEHPPLWVSLIARSP